MEINDALVTAITRELLKRLGGSSAGKKTLIVSGAAALSSTLTSLGDWWELVCHTGLEAPYPEDAELIVTRLSVQALVRVAEGDAGCTPEGAVLLWALLRGKKPVIVEEGIEWRAFKDAMNPALAAGYLACERTLAAYGVRIMPEASAVSAFSRGEAAPSTIPAANDGSSVKIFGVPPHTSSPVKAPGKRKRVISETEVIKLCPVAGGEGQTLEIGANDILTPLAVDYIARMRVCVNRIE